MKLSERISQISASPTLVITQKAQEMKKSGIDIISFGAGEPDFDTPKVIREAAKTAIDEGFTRYAPAAGTPELRNAVSNYIMQNTGIKYQPNQVIITCGAKAAIFIALHVLLNPGDEVIVPAPFWVSYPEQVKLAGGSPVIVQTREENSFKITPEELERATTGKTRIVVINSPSNPVGAVYSKEELNKLIRICISKGIIVLADEIYDRLVYDNPFASVISSHPEAPEHTIYINGVSKSFAMTGWRMGYAAGPPNIIAAMTKYQGQMLTSITTFVQKASITALTSPPEIVRAMANEFKLRRDLIVNLINKIPNVSCVRPAGAFYAFVNISKYFGRTYNGTKIDSSSGLAEFLLNEAHVAVVPGSAFGTEGYIRLSFATSVGEIEKGVMRIGESLGKLAF